MPVAKLGLVQDSDVSKRNHTVAHMRNVASLSLPYIQEENVMNPPEPEENMAALSHHGMLE